MRSDSNQKHNLVFHDGKTASATHAFAAFLGKEVQVRLGDDTSLQHGSALAPSVGLSNPPHSEPASPYNDGGLVLHVDPASHERQQTPCLLPDDKATASEEMSDEHQSQQARPYTILY